MDTATLRTPSPAPGTRRRRRALAVALVALAVLPQCCCCVIPLGYGPRLVPALHKLLPASSRTAVAAPRTPAGK